MRHQSYTRARMMAGSGLATAVILTAVILLSLLTFLQPTMPVLSQTAVSVSQTAVTGASPAGNSGTPTVYLPLVLAPVPTGPCYYAEVNDAIVIEMESIPLVEQWQLETSFPGYTGSGYIVWRGPEYWGEPGHAILSYPLHINYAGTYRLNIRNSHTGDPTLSNDIWVRLDGGYWTKAFSHITDQWNYFLQFDFPDHRPHDWVEFHNLQPGVHTLDISARSAGFWLDRLVFSANGMGQLDTWPESPCIVP